VSRTPDRLFLDFQAAIAGRYALEGELGRGGMGIVYLARDLRLERVVAIKLLPPDRGAAPLRERFLKEARTAAQLSHPHIIPIHAVEDAGGFVFFVMAYVDGETLGARVRREGPLKPPEAARILREVAWALAYAHGQGVVHRDVKPDNILLERASGRTLVADFGIARLVQATGASGEGELIGTPEYMSPEQAAGGRIDGRSDLYSLGVVGYVALAARLPFTAPTVAALLVQHASKTPPPLNVPGAPRALIAAIERCLAKDPAERFQTAEELAGAFAGILETRRELPVPVRAFLAEGDPRSRAGIVGSLLIAAIGVPAGLAFMIGQGFGGTVPAAAGWAITALGGLLFAAAVGSPLVLHARRIRRFLAAGYAHQDLVHALTLNVERRREEQEYMSGRGPTRFERLMTWKARASAALATICGAAAFVVPYPAVQWVLGIFALSCTTAFATGVAAVAARHQRLDVQGQRQLRFWQGPIGRWLFKVAGLGFKRPPTQPAVVDRPTEVALALAALDLFSALPTETQRQLGDLPAVVRRLEEQVRRQRAAGASVALSALETIRLDLLKVHGGVGTLDGLTADLAAARRIGEDVDALLDGLREAGDAAPGA
jgi:serine/threonine-protein kinase